MQHFPESISSLVGSFGSNDTYVIKVFVDHLDWLQILETLQNKIIVSGFHYKDSDELPKQS